MFEKGIFAEAIEAGARVEGIFCIAEKRLGETQKGAPYLALTLMDRTGAIEARMWEGENPRQADARFSKGDFVLVRGDAQLFRDSVQLRVRALEPVPPEDVEAADFMPRAPVEIEALEKKLDRFVKSISREPLNAFLKALFRKGGGVRRLFVAAPAAKKMHQAYLGGLLEHSVAVAGLAHSIAGFYPVLDRDLLVAGALVHDLGKTEEFRYDAPPIDYTDRGRLLGHMAIGVEIIDRCAAETGIESGHPDIMALKHMVLSHHGQREYGAAVLPMTPEALVLHLIDDIDAKMSFLYNLSEGLQGQGPEWTPYQRLFERYFFLKGHADSEALAQEADGEQDADAAPVKQPSMFDI